MLGEVLTGIFGKTIYDLIKEASRGMIADKDDDLIGRIHNALEEASKSFFARYNNEFGEPSSSFIARQENINIIVKSMFYGNNNQLINQLSPEGFDGAMDVSGDALYFFVSKLNDAMMRDFRLNKILVEKCHINESRETSKKIMDILNILINQGQNQETLDEDSSKNWIMKDEQGNEAQVIEGKQYNTKFSNGVAITYMFKGGHIYVDYTDIHGQKSYFEWDIDGNQLKNSIFPYPLTEYKLVIPEDQIVNKSIFHLPNDLRREVIELKWDNHADVIYNVKGELGQIKLDGKWKIKHLQKIICLNI